MDVLALSINFADYILGWNVPAILCLVVGIALIICEMLLPGFGVSGILGIIALIFAVVFRADSPEAAIITIALMLVLILFAGFVIFRSLKKGRLARSSIVLDDSIEKDATSLSTQDIQALVGREGVCLNTLRPSGNADFDGLKLDVVSDGEFIKAGSAVRIVRVEGLRILVKEV